MPHRRVASLLLLLLAACNPTSSHDAPGASVGVAPSTSGVSAGASSAAVGASSAAVGASSAAPGASVAPSDSAGPGGAGTMEDVARFFGPTRLPGTRTKDTVRGAGGLLIGIPEGWVTENVYDEFDIARPKNPIDRSASALYNVAPMKAGAPFALDLRAVAELSAILRIKDTTWDPPVEVRVGPQGYRGLVSRGRGLGLARSEGEKEALAALVEVPTRKPAIFIGAWMKAHPEREEALIDMLRALAPCEFKPNKGCVKVEP
ncbi:hypothetical protein [Chondromyces crocatus]|nr:hypothetical protein [Chondromyces crocatus]